MTTSDVLEQILERPMLLQEKQISQAISDILETFEQSRDLSVTETAEALVDMIGRQGSNFRPLSRDDCQKVDKWLIENWSERPIELLDALTTLVLMTNSIRGLRLLKKAALSNDSTAKEIAVNGLQEAILNGQLFEQKL